LVAEIASGLLFSFQAPVALFASAQANRHLDRPGASLYHATSPLLFKHFPFFERPPPLALRPAPRAPQRVTNTGYSPISPSMYLASNLAWISSSLR